MKTASWLLMTLLLGVAIPQVSSALEIAPSRHVVGGRAKDAFIPYIASHPFDQANPQVKRLLVSIHSSNFDALQYYDNARFAASKTPGALPETLILAPQFFEQKAIPGPAPEKMLFWRVSPFRGSSRGGVGPLARPVSVSAFEVLDQWLTDLTKSNRYPGLKDLVIVGHSGGGQLVQRYALAGKFEPPSQIRIRYVVSAPSSYAYPGPERLNRRTNRFSEPNAEAVRQCPKYDHWGYGLKAPYAYFAAVDASLIAKRYASRNVFYLCGSNDSDPNDDTIGKSCGAMMQGRHRLERMRIYSAFLEFKYGKSISRRHQFAIVRGVGHFGRGNMASPAGLKALFAPIR